MCSASKSDQSEYSTQPGLSTSGQKKTTASSDSSRTGRRRVRLRDGSATTLPPNDAGWSGVESVLNDHTERKTSMSRGERDERGAGKGRLRPSSRRGEGKREAGACPFP